MCLHIFLSARCAWLSDGCLCVCECTIWRWVFGCWYNQAIERCTQTEGPVGAMRKGRHCDYRCVCAAVCVRVCVCEWWGPWTTQMWRPVKGRGKGVFESQTVIVVVCCAGQWRLLAGPGTLDCNSVLLRVSFHVSWLKACEIWELAFGQGRMMWHSHGFSCHWLKKGCFQMVGYEISFEDDDSPSAAPLENVYGEDRIHQKKKNIINKSELVC